MVAERRNFHRVYDLTERLLPAWDDARHTLPAEQRAGRCCAAPAAIWVSFALNGWQITIG